MTNTTSSDGHGIPNSCKGYGLTSLCGMLLLALTLYVATYTLIVGRKYSLSGMSPTGEWPAEPEYVRASPLNDFLTKVYFPVHRIDRQVRPNFWNEKWDTHLADPKGESEPDSKPPQ